MTRDQFSLAIAALTLALLTPACADLPAHRDARAPTSGSQGLDTDAAEASAAQGGDETLRLSVDELLRHADEGGSEGDLGKVDAAVSSLVGKTDEERSQSRSRYGVVFELTNEQLAKGTELSSAVERTTKLMLAETDGNVDARLDELEGKLDELLAKLGDVSDRIDSLEDKVDESVEAAKEAEKAAAEAKAAADQAAAAAAAQAAAEAAAKQQRVDACVAWNQNGIAAHAYAAYWHQGYCAQGYLPHCQARDNETALVIWHQNALAACGNA